MNRTRTELTKHTAVLCSYASAESYAVTCHSSAHKFLWFFSGFFRLSIKIIISLSVSQMAVHTTTASGQPKRKEIYKYVAPWTIYSMNWSVRRDKRFRLAVGSYIEEYNNKVWFALLWLMFVTVVFFWVSGSDCYTGWKHVRIQSKNNIRSSISHNQNHVGSRLQKSTSWFVSY